MRCSCWRRCSGRRSGSAWRSLVALVGRRRAPALWLARRVWAPGMIAIGLSRLEVVGRERVDLRRALLLRRQPPVLARYPGALRRGAGAAPLPRQAGARAGAVPRLVHRRHGHGLRRSQRRRKAVASVGRAGELLAAGGSLVSFPEGTRAAPDELGRFKSGGFAAVLEAGGAPSTSCRWRSSGRDGSCRATASRSGRARSRCVSASRSRWPVSPSRIARELARRAEAAVAALLGRTTPSGLRLPWLRQARQLPQATRSKIVEPDRLRPATGVNP